MDLFSERLRLLRHKKEITLEELADKLNTTKATLSRYENNKRVPDIDFAKKISDYFSVSLDYLLGKEEYSSAREDSKKYTIHLTNLPLGRTVKIPLLGRIPAGTPIYAEENIIDYIDTPSDAVKDGEYFYLKVQGDSMINADIKDGYHVLIKKQSDVENGEIAAVLINEFDATLKRVKKVDDQIILYPENPDYDPIFVKKGEHIEIIGKVVQVMFQPKKK